MEGLLPLSVLLNVREITIPTEFFSRRRNIVEVIFAMTNPNKEAMTVLRVVGDLYVGDEQAGSVDTAISASLPGGETTELVVPVVGISEEAMQRIREARARDELPVFRGRFTMGPPEYLRKMLPWLKGKK